MTKKSRAKSIAAHRAQAAEKSAKQSDRLEILPQGHKVSELPILGSQEVKQTAFAMEDEEHFEAILSESRREVNDTSKAIYNSLHLAAEGDLKHDRVANLDQTLPYPGLNSALIPDQSSTCGNASSNSQITPSISTAKTHMEAANLMTEQQQILDQVVTSIPAELESIVVATEPAQGGTWDVLSSESDSDEVLDESEDGYPSRLRSNSMPPNRTLPVFRQASRARRLSNEMQHAYSEDIARASVIPQTNDTIWCGFGEDILQLFDYTIDVTEDSWEQDNIRTRIFGSDTTHKAIEAAKRMNIFKVVEDADDQDWHYDIATLRKLGSTVDACLFDDSGTRIGGDLWAQFSIVAEHHMAQIVILIHQKPVLKAQRSTTKDNYDYDDRLDTQEDDSDDPDELELISRTQSIIAYINYESLRDARRVNVSKAKRVSGECNDHLTTDFSNDMLSALNDIDAITDRKIHPLSIELSFDPTTAALERVWAGTPDYGADIATLLQSGKMKLLIEGNEFTDRLLEAIVMQMHGNKTGKDPLDVWLSSKKRAVLDAEHVHLEPIFPDGMPSVNLKDFTYSQKAVYHSWKEYAVVLYVACAREQQTQKEREEDYQNTAQSMWLTRIPGASRTLDGEEDWDGSTSDKVYLGFLSPSTLDMRFSKDTRLTIYFGEADPTEDDHGWTAKVASEKLTFGPEDYIPIYIRRRYDNILDVHDNRQVKVTTGFEDAFITDADELFKNPSVNANMVRVIIKVHNEAYENKLRAIERLNYAHKDDQALDWNTAWRKLLVRYVPAESAPRDIFASVRSVDPSFMKHLELDKVQKRGIEAFQFAPSGLGIFTAPAGTGKTHVALQASIPFLMNKDRCGSVLALCYSNTGTNKLAKDMHTSIERLIKAGIVPKNSFVVRLHSSGTEDQILKADAQASRLRKNPPTRPADVDWAATEATLSELQQFVVTAYGQDHQKLYAGISDSRVVHKNLSMGVRMLQVAGVDGHVCNITHPDAMEFHRFRESLERYTASANTDKAQKQAFKAEIKALYKHVLEIASAVIGTPAAVSSYRNREILKERIGLIVIDEFGRIRDDELIPTLAERYTRFPGIIGVGDLMQLPPTALMSRAHENPYQSALGLSFMQRLSMQGFPIQRLIMQRRMVPQIAAIPNALGYSNTVKNHADTGPVRRPLSIIFTNLAGKYLPRGRNGEKHFVLFLDVNKGGCHRIEVNNRKSKSCDLYVILTMSLVEDLLSADVNQKCTIAILACYTAQAKSYSIAVDNMRRQGVEGWDRISIVTVDSSMGEQWDFVVVDLIIGYKVGFVADLRRLIVMTSRARNGMAVISSSQLFQDSRGRKRQAVRKLFTTLKPYRKIVRPDKFLPNCRYFEPHSSSARLLRGPESSSIFTAANFEIPNAETNSENRSSDLATEATEIVPVAEYVPENRYLDTPATISAIPTSFETPVVADAPARADTSIKESGTLSQEAEQVWESAAEPTAVDVVVISDDWSTQSSALQEDVAW